MNRSSGKGDGASNLLLKEVASRFGVLPNFFKLSAETPQIAENLWGFARFGYLDNPLPSLFKERLFVYLSRYCEVRYCIGRHVGFLVGLGNPSGDQHCPPETVEQVVTLIGRTLPTGAELDPHIWHLESHTTPLGVLPVPNHPTEDSIFACTTHVFLQTSQATKCLNALRRMFDPRLFQHLLVFLSFIRTAHFWTQVHPELELEDDIKRLLAVHEALAKGILNDVEAAKCEAAPMLIDELIMLRRERALWDEVQAHEQQFGSLIAATSQIVWTTGPDGQMLHDNPKWRAFTGMSFSEWKDWGWLEAIHPQDRSRAIDAWRLAVECKTICSIEYRIRRHDGEYRWTSVRAVPLMEADHSIREWVGTNSDITDRKQAEDERENLVSLAENSTDFIAMFNFAGVPSFINRAGLDAVGIDGMEQARRISPQDFFFPEDQARIMDDFFPSTIEKGNDEIEIRFRHFKTGDARWMLFRLFVLTDPDGCRTGLATVSRDITERKRLEDELRQLAAHLSETNHRKDEFLATLAHELRNPLAPIRNGLELIKLAPNDAVAIEQTRRMMERQLGQMVRLIDDLLDLSRINSGKVELRIDKADLAKVVQLAIETSRPLIDSSGHDLVVHLPAGPIVVAGDVIRLAQVISNLLNNAAKYTEFGGVVTLTLTQQESNAILSVRDTGVGIPAQMLPRVFDMFTQIDRSLERSQGGLGIGLSLVKGLVELHGGAVEAKSDGEGMGSEFVVRLPLSRSVFAAHEGVPAPVTKSHCKRRILVVDDNRDAAASLSLMLEIMGHEIQTAHDGSSAVEMAEAFKPEMILLDIGMPKLNGYEAARHIRERPWAAKVLLVALTGWGQLEDKRKSQESGFDYHMVKPIEPALLEKLLTGIQASIDP